MLKSVLRLFGKPNAKGEMVGDWLLTEWFNAFLDDPSPKNFHKVRKLVLNDKAYRASSTELDDAVMLIESGQRVAAQERLRAMHPGWLLSPRAHQLAAEVARSLGDHETERRETLIHERCVEGILNTGQGTRDAPYLVTHAGDEYDLLDHFERKFGRQSLVQDSGRSLEKIECQDGSELWFDLTDLHSRLDEPPRLSKPRRPSQTR